ncbi:TPA: core-2/I-branching enzyme, partial [Klebsiella pneumoniae]|nr:core-2/I-branching enzyme [Klebsiella pneumoniae]
MKKVFGVVCHKVTNPLVYTVNYLSSFDENEVLIHVDANSKIEDFLFLSSKNVIFVKNRVKIKWGGYSQVAATIELLKTASANCFDYFFLISGDDLPCKTNKDINDFLNEIENKNIV